MANKLPTDFGDSGRLRADVVGLVCGGIAVLFRGVMGGANHGQDFPLLQMGVELGLALAAGMAVAAIKPADLISPRLATGIGGRLGIRAGFKAALLAGALLTCLATVDAFAAQTAAAEYTLKYRMWLTLFVSLAALLPSVLCGFVGGALVAGLMDSRIPENAGELPPPGLPWLRPFSFGMVSGCAVGFLLPFSFLGRASKVDPPPVVEKPATPTSPASSLPLPLSPPSPSESPRFHYEAPADIKTAKLGQIQADFTKTIDGIANEAAISLSPEGSLLAYGDRSADEPRVTVFDLDAFKPVASIRVPAFPKDGMAWSPDRKALVCTIQGRAGERRIWILDLAAQRAMELPRPRDRDTPAGDVFWWQEHEVAFFPEDEPPLVLDLEKLTLQPAMESSFLKKMDEPTKRGWLDGPRWLIPASKEWQLDLKTVFHRIEPPSRRDSKDPWHFRGDTFCALSHPDLPVSYSFKWLPVVEGMSVLCAPDASKIIRIHDGRAEVTFMKVTSSPDCQLEVSMPVSFDDIKDETLKQQVVSHELCAFVFAPLVNPLSHQTVGPDYDRLKGVVRLLEWKERKAVFFVTTFDQDFALNDVISTLHTWDNGNMELWSGSDQRDWWSLTKVLPGKFLDSLPIMPGLAPLATPSLLTLEAKGTSLVAIKQSARPKTPKPRTPSSTPVLPQFTEAELKTFLMMHHIKASKGDVAGMVADYADEVDFLDKGHVQRSTIQAEEMAQRQKWPKGTETIPGNFVLAKEGDIWVAKYTIEFSNENSTGDWNRGRADLSMTIQTRPEGFRITSQRAKAYEVVDNKSAKIPGAPITVPRPCYVASVRSGEKNDIEVTDQISFTNGLSWHRTYRQLSRDGLVINLCRAIYEGRAVVSPDRKSARVNVGAQGWARGLIKQEFLRVCERSAAALSGQEFHFRFTSEGMAADQGTLFQIRK